MECHTKTFDQYALLVFRRMLFFDQYGPIDRIEYDITVQISALQHGVCVGVRSCVRAYAIEIKPEILHASSVYAFGRAYGLLYKMATFIAKQRLFNTVYCLKEKTFLNSMPF